MLGVLILCAHIYTTRAYISPFGNCIQIIRKMVDALGNAPSESEDNGFTVRSVSLTGYASIIKFLDEVLVVVC